MAVRLICQLSLPAAGLTCASRYCHLTHHGRTHVLIYTISDMRREDISICAVILAGAATPQLSECLLSLTWADQRLVVVDDTPTGRRAAAIAERCGARAETLIWPGFAAARNAAAGMTSATWLFYVDVDETVSADLQSEIVMARLSGRLMRYDAWSMPRRNILLGRPMLHGGWWPDRQVRLVRRGAGRYVGLVHETFILHRYPQRVGQLTSPLVHRTHHTIADLLERVNTYSTLEALDDHSRWTRVASWPAPVFWAVAVARPLAHFCRRYIAQQGYADGSAGAVEAGIQAFYRFCCLVKRRERMAQLEQEVYDTDASNHT